MLRLHWIIPLIVLVSCITFNSFGAEAPALGPAFESQSAGIAFHPPADCRQIKRGVSTDEIVEFINDAKSWRLRLSSAEFKQRVELTKYTDNAGVTQVGMLASSLDLIKKIDPNAEVLRQEIINVGPYDTGMLVVRYNQTGQQVVSQQALMRASSQQYYILNFTSPAAAHGADIAVPNAAEKEAADTFRLVVNSIKLLDRGALREEQDQRLLRTRSFFINLQEGRIRAVLAKEQFLRLILNGKDIGYTYIVEEGDSAAPAGVRIGIRAHSVPDAGLSVEAGSWLTCSFDRRSEQWTNAVDFASSVSKSSTLEFGSSALENIREDQGDPKSPVGASQEVRVVSVSTGNRTTVGQPVKRQAPAWYLPQAIGHLLPRLVASQPQTLLFATYVGDQHEVMSRYIDVGKEATITLAGEKVQAVPIKDRIGIEGSITTHYIGSDGKYLGSVNDDSKIIILATTAAQLKKLWPDANLTPPPKIQHP